MAAEEKKGLYGPPEAASLSLVLTARDKQGLAFQLGALRFLSEEGILKKCTSIHACGLSNVLALQWMHAINTHPSYGDDYALTDLRYTQFYARTADNLRDSQTIPAVVCQPFIDQFLCANQEGAALRHRVRRPCEWFSPWQDAVRAAVCELTASVKDAFEPMQVTRERKDQQEVPVFTLHTYDRVTRNQIAYTTLAGFIDPQGPLVSMHSMQRDPLLGLLVSSSSHECTLADGASRPTWGVNPFCVKDVLDSKERQRRRDVIVLDGLSGHPQNTETLTALIDAHHSELQTEVQRSAGDCMWIGFNQEDATTTALRATPTVFTALDRVSMCALVNAGYKNAHAKIGVRGSRPHVPYDRTAFL